MLMNFNEFDKLKALAIVNVFETSRPFGNFAACVVLNDGAGISYGISQFTHRSGSLLNVIEAYLAAGGRVGATVMLENLPLLRLRTPKAINSLAANRSLRNALRDAAATPEMREAQWQVARGRYLEPAVKECGRRGFVRPLSLAVVYDSMIHGSWERIAAGIAIAKGAASEKETEWILRYLRKRQMWLSGIPRLKTTTYRTRFFLGQISIGNWELKMPITVQGVRLTEAMFTAEFPSLLTNENTRTAETDLSEPQVSTNVIKGAFGSAAATFDRVEGAVSSVVRRTDAVKSLWTTVAGTVWQAAWGIFGFAAGIPHEIWIVVAIIAAALMLFYLYRQLEMGKIRERR